MPQQPLIMVQPTPADKNRQAMARSMLGNAMQYKPLRHPMQAVAQALQGVVGGYMANKTQEGLDARREAARQNMADAMSVYKQSVDIGNPNAFEEMNQQLALNPDTADYGMQSQMAGIVAQQKPRTPKYITAFDPESPTQASIYDVNDMSKPIAPAPMKSNATQISYSPDGGFNLTMGGYGKMPNVPAPKGAQTSLFKDTIAGQQALDAISNIKSMYEPEFLTYKGSASSMWNTFLNKLDPNERDAFTKRRAAFMSALGREFLTFRKWATGVAGGEKEMAEIKRITFSEDDSPQDFEAKINYAEQLTRQLNARRKAALTAGINNEQAFKQYIAEHPLSSIPTLQERGDQLEKLGYDKPKIIRILINEGYINRPPSQGM